MSRKDIQYFSQKVISALERHFLTRITKVDKCCLISHAGFKGKQIQNSISKMKNLWFRPFDSSGVCKATSCNWGQMLQPDRIRIVEKEICVK